MKPLIRSLLVSCSLFNLQATANDSLAFESSRNLPGEAVGLKSVVVELCSAKDLTQSFVVATVHDVASKPADDVSERRWHNKTSNIEMVDRPSRVSFELRVTSLGRQVEAGRQTAIEWITDYAANKPGVMYGKLYRDYREAVRARPLHDGGLICFVPPLQNKNGELTDAINVLPSGSLEALSNAASWRTANPALFQLPADDKVIETLRAELVSANPYRRLMAMLQLIKLAKFGAADVGVVLKAASTPVETAATTMLVITDAPDLVASVGDALVDPGASRPLFDGVAIGAATHFLNQPNGERLWGAAKSFQIVRASAPNLPDALKATVSFPLLLKLADVVAPKDVNPPLETTSLLYKLLKSSAALRK